MALNGLSSDPLDIWKYFLQNGALPQGQQPGAQGPIAIQDLPEDLQQFVKSKKSDFSEGDPDKIDTQNELRKLLSQVVGQDQSGVPTNKGMEALGNLSKDDLTQLLIDWLLNKQSEQNKPSGGNQNLGNMGNRNFSAGPQPASWNPGSGGGSSGGGGGAPSGGGSSGSPVTAKATGSAGGPPPSAQEMEKAKYAMKYFQDHGLTKAQAAAIVGNMMVESHMDSGNNSGDGGTSGGLSQWHNGRRDALQAWASANGRDWKDFNTQLEYTLLEAKQRGNLDGLSKTDAGAGAAYWDQNFEVSDGSARQQRINNAEMLMNA